MKIQIQTIHKRKLQYFTSGLHAAASRYYLQLFKHGARNLWICCWDSWRWLTQNWLHEYGPSSQCFFVQGRSSLLLLCLNKKEHLCLMIPLGVLLECIVELDFENGQFDHPVREKALEISHGCHRSSWYWGKCPTSTITADFTWTNFKLVSIVVLRSLPNRDYICRINWHVLNFHKYMAINS